MSKPILVATDVIEAAGRGHQEAVKALQRAETDASPAISVLTEISLSDKCKSREQIDMLLSLLSRFDVLSMDLRTSRKSLELRRRYGLNTSNSLIAATAIVHGRSLVTMDRDVFNPVVEISLESYPLAT